MLLVVVAAEVEVEVAEADEPVAAGLDHDFSTFKVKELIWRNFCKKYLVLPWPTWSSLTELRHWRGDGIADVGDFRDDESDDYCDGDYCDDRDGGDDDDGDDGRDVDGDKAEEVIRSSCCYDGFL